MGRLVIVNLAIRTALAISAVTDVALLTLSDAPAGSNNFVSAGETTSGTAVQLSVKSNKQLIVQSPVALAVNTGINGCCTFFST